MRIRGMNMVIDNTVTSVEWNNDKINV
jgi:hypothetical protein